MKKLILLWFLFINFFAFSQGSKINYSLQDTIPFTGDPVENLKLPLRLIFTSNFNGKAVMFLNENGSQVLALNHAKFGEGYLRKDPETNSFVIEIDENKSVNPGEEKIDQKFILQIGQAKIHLSLSKDVPPSKPDEPKKNEGYEPGYIYYDAFTLLDNSTMYQTREKIFKAYGVTVETIGNNKFLYDIFKSYFPRRESGSSLPEGGEPYSLPKSIGNTDVTYFAAGLARFLANRTKEELNEAFFSKMKQQLNAFPELKTAFPKTASFLNIIETYSYASIVQVLKEAFETDIHNLPENLYNFKSLNETNCDKIAICGKTKTCSKYTNCRDRLKKLSDFFAGQTGHWVSLGLLSIKEGAQSTNPAELIKTIVSSEEFTELKSISKNNNQLNDYNVTSCLELGNFISQSLVSKEDGHVWISQNQLNSLFSTKNAFKVYLGLLLSFELRKDNEKKIITFYKTQNDTITFGDILTKVYSGYLKLEPLIKNTYAIYNTTNNAIKKITTASENSVEATPQVLYDYYTTLTSSLRPIAYNPVLSTYVGKDIAASYDKVEKFLNPSVEIAYHIATKKYSSAIYDASVLLSCLNEIKDEDSTQVFKPLTKSFLKYGTLISTVATAQSSDEVKQALEASALPMGSYTIKRKTCFSMSINAYVGGYWRYATAKIDKHFLPPFGLTAPIGLNFSSGFSKAGKSGGLSINLQIIDVGALVNYYFLKGDTASIPNDFKIRLSNIFSPGFNVSYNIPKTPLSLAWGGQYIPTLYKYEQINGKNELTPINAWRWQLSLLVDIPLYNIVVQDFKK